MGLNREYAARFSFLMSVPAILGASLWKFRKVEADAVEWSAVGIGVLVSMVSGYLALILLVKLVKNGRLSHFAWYCWFAAILAGVISFWPA